MMFNYFYKRYKIEVLDTNLKLVLKELRPYEKIFLVILIFGAISSALFSVLRIIIGTYISVVVMLIAVVWLMIVRNRKTEQRRILKENIEPEAKERMKKVVNLLVSFRIDIKDEKQLDNIINQAKMQKDVYDGWKKIRKALSGMAKYIILPIITIFLSIYFNVDDMRIILVRASVLILMCSAVVLIVVSFAENINDIINSDIRKLDYLIRDIEDVKTFSQKALHIIDRDKKRKHIEDVKLDIGEKNIKR